MDDVRSATESLLADKPALEDDLEAVLVVDADAEGWTFDDVPLDSGAFGELVSHGIVVKETDEYHVANRTAVRAALDGDEDVVKDDGASGPGFSFSLPSIDQRAALALSGALLLVVAMRAFPIPSVFRGDTVVLSSNDPYAYRYVVELLLEQSGGPVDFSVLNDPPMRNGEPLFVVSLWFAAALLGGGQYATGFLLAVYPLVSAVFVSLLLYLFTLRLTNDRRVALAAVVLLAVVPDHALRTAVGFADHHAFDYVWLILTAYGLVLTVDNPDIREWAGSAASVVLAVGITGQVLAWEAGPLLILPVGLVVAGSAFMLVASKRYAVRDHSSLLLGTGISAAFVWAVHSTLNWHTDLVASTPALLFVGALFVTVFAELFVRFDLSGGAFAATELVGGVGTVVGLFVVFPSFESTLTERVDVLFATRQIAETRSLFQGDLGLIVAPIFSFGLVLFIAIPYLGWASWLVGREQRRGLLVPCTYAWFLLFLAVVQVRFSGELGTFAAFFAGLGFVHLLSVVDLTDTPPLSLVGGNRTTSSGERKGISVPSGENLRYLVVMILLVASVGLLFTPLKIDLTTIEDQEYNAAAATQEHAASSELEYPENYVLSQWDRNRMYNYFVSGDSRSYGFARSVYNPFLTSTDPQAAYQQLGSRRGYVVTTRERLPSNLNDSAVGAILHEDWGSGSSSSAGLGHYRAIHASSDGSIKVFQVVPGAVLTGNATPGETVVVRTNVSVSGTEFIYRRTTVADSTGAFRVQVPYTGTYTVGTARISITESQILEAETVAVSSVNTSSSVAVTPRVHSSLGENLAPRTD
ncbi:STT3 domain-containing protein [Haloarchaeobius baliensis]|uniref:STT3 domain-containing protein n=1 Tax=Haloarchaeobius baliensis TaxID=1670458 RepID=UPI003F8810FA